MTWPDEKRVYEGTFKDNIREGYGAFSWGTN